MHRRIHSVFLGLSVAVFLCLCGSIAWSANGLGMGYQPKYGDQFAHFDYANPLAPKGGNITLAAMGSFDKLNPFTLKGSAATDIGGLGDTGLVFESLASASQDEPFSMYGLLADDMALAPDRLSMTFHINPLARFHNGDAVTASDVKFSFDTLRSKAAHPQFRSYWSDVKQAVVVDRLTIRFEFSRTNSELHMILGQMPVFSPKWLGGKTLDKVTLETPIGSGPYRVEQFDLGKRVVYRRDPQYWGKDLPVRRGTYNFDTITYRYYKDDTVRLEAFKAGEFDFTFENSAKQWARGYEGPKFRSGQIVRTELKHENNAGMQGFAMNLRRPLFGDVRVRKALELAFDFEWANRQLFYNQYTRSRSYFTNSEMEARGVPDKAELQLLGSLKLPVPAAVFQEPVPPPSTVAPRSLRDNLREARDLLNAAGWVYRDGALRNARGEPFEFELLLYSKAFERIAAPFARNLEKLGIRMDYRLYDLALAQKKLDTFDYDMTVITYGASESPGNELYGRFHSRSAAEQGSDNAFGLKDPLVDALIDRVVTSRSRAELVTACKVLDRVLRAGHYLVPNWHNPTHRVAYWNRFEYPKTLPRYYSPVDWALRTWWAKPVGGQ